MVELILGRSFWSMILRFALFPVVVSPLVLLSLIMFKGEGGETGVELTFLQHAAVVLWSVAGWTWFGWGFAFWRFDRSEIPVRSFAAYPLLSGLTTVPVFWMLMSKSADPGISGYIAVTVFGAIAGPLLALFAATACRYLPQATNLRRLRD